jgi:hypothetical protein
MTTNNPKSHEAGQAGKIPNIVDLGISSETPTKGKTNVDTMTISKGRKAKSQKLH